MHINFVMIDKEINVLPDCRSHEATSIKTFWKVAAFLHSVNLADRR